MKKTRILIALLFFSCGLFAQNCFDFVQNHFDNVEDICGYHGGLNFKIQETDSFDDEMNLSSDFFIEKWIQQKYGESGYLIGFLRTPESEISPNVLRYNFTYNDFILEDAVFLLSFGNDGKLRSYNVSCPKNLKNISKGIAYIAANAFDPGIDDAQIISDVKGIKFHNDVIQYKETIVYYNDASIESKMIIDLLEGQIIYETNSSIGKGAKSKKAKNNINACVSGEESGFVGVALPPYNYPNADDCEYESNIPAYIGFQNSHEYIPEQTIGPNSGTDLKIKCVNDLRQIVHIPNWIQCINNDDDYKHSTNNFLFCSDPGISSADVGKFHYTMAYFHLAGFYKHLNSNIIINGEYSFLPMPTGKILFDPYDTSLAQNYTVAVDNVGISYINFPAADTTTPFAEDAQYIVEAGMHAYWENILPDNPTSTGSGSDGLFYGAIDYMTWRYSSDELEFPSTDLLTWGASGNFERSVEVSESYSQAMASGNFGTPQLLGQVFSSTLHEIAEDPILSTEIADFLLYKNLPFMVDTNDQPEAAQMLYDIAEDVNMNIISSSVEINDIQLCRIAKILKKRYATLVAPLTYDFYVRDSYEGQPKHWSDPTPQLEDIGNEPNTETYNFAKSYDIWNKINAGSTNPNDIDHENPQYNNGALNYLYVDIRNNGCAELDPDATVHVYLREAHSASVWPDGWTMGWYTGTPPSDIYDPPPSNPLVGYEITSDPNDVFQPMGVSVEDYMLNYTDSKGRDVYRYEIPWVPFNPLALPEHSQWGADAWGCLLVRLESDLDPMPANEYGSSAWDNNVASNNYCIRNTSILHVAGNPVAPPGEPGEPNVSAWNVVSIADPDPDDPDDDGTNTNDVIFSILPDVMIGPGTDVFTYVDIEIILSDKFFAAWKKGGLQGKGFEWTGKNKIKITGQDFIFKNLKLTRKIPHRIFFSVSQLKSFNNIAFDMTMTNETGCPKGSQEFLVVGDSPIAIENKNSNSAARNQTFSDFEIFPNPIDSYVTITGESLEEITSLKIYNALGLEIEKNLNNDYKNEIKLDMSDNESGIYFVILRTKDKVDKVLKFIKL